MNNKQQANRRTIQLLVNLIDELEERTGVVFPSWMALDAFATSCADHDINVRKCCWRHKRSYGLQSSHYLTLDDRIVVTCTTCDPPVPGSNSADKAGKTHGPYKKLLVKHYQNTLFEFFVRRDNKNEDR